MGCCGSKKDVVDEPKKFSWEDRPRLDPSQFMIDGIEGETVIREPGSINGQPFVVQNCKYARIFLLDHVATVTVDDCYGCQIIIGPTQSSVFIRDCQSCQCIISCQQFRTRDCSKLDIFLLCTTQPIIEASSKMRFGCYQLEYEGLSQQMENSTLAVFNNNWYNIHDFTPMTEAKNWSLIPEDVSMSDIINIDTRSNKNSPPDGNGDAQVAAEDNFVEPPFPVQEPKMSISVGSSVVPLTRGTRKMKSSELCFILVFFSSNSRKVAMRIIHDLLSKVDLVQTKEVQLSPDEASKIVSDGTSSMCALAKQGPSIGLEFNGDSCIELCKDVLKATVPTDTVVYASPDSSAAQREIELFYNFCDMRMSV